MRNVRPSFVYSAAVAVIFCAGCCHLSNRQEQLGDLLPLLTETIQGVVCYHEPPVPDGQLLQVATEEQPALKVFANARVKIAHSDSKVVVLVCSPDGKYAWFEDASWTPGKVDKVWHRQRPLHPAEFSLDPYLPSADPKQQ